MFEFCIEFYVEKRRIPKLISLSLLSVGAGRESAHVHQSIIIEMYVRQKRQRTREVSLHVS